MTRGRAIALAGAGLLVLILAVCTFGGGESGRERAADGAIEPGGGTPDPAQPGAAVPELTMRHQAVRIYQRAATPDLQLVPVIAEIVWLAAPVERARQVVELVIEGVPGGSAGVPPVPLGVRYRDVRITTGGTAWVDMEGATLGRLGADHESALVAALARSLTEAFPDEIRAVGLLVDGNPRASLAGHVDITRTYTGSDWPLASGSDTGSISGSETGSATGSDTGSDTGQ